MAKTLWWRPKCCGHESPGKRPGVYGVRGEPAGLLRDRALFFAGCLLPDGDAKGDGRRRWIPRPAFHQQHVCHWPSQTGRQPGASRVRLERRGPATGARISARQRGNENHAHSAGVGGSLRPRRHDRIRRRYVRCLLLSVVGSLCKFGQHAAGPCGRQAKGDRDSSCFGRRAGSPDPPALGGEPAGRSARWGGWRAIGGLDHERACGLASSD